MAKAKTVVKKVSDKLKKVSENFSIYQYDNGYMIEVQGRDLTDNYSTVKILCNTPEEAIELIKEVFDMERDS